MKATVFTTAWCGPCKMMKASYLNELVDSGYPIEFVDVDEYPNLAKVYEITSVPTTIFFDEEDNIISEQVGFIPKNKFLQYLGES